MSPEHIAAVFGRVLNLTHVTLHADFFDLGGDSLLGTRVLSAIARDLGADLTYDDLVANPTPAALFDLVAAVTP